MARRPYHEGGISKRYSKDGKLLGYQVRVYTTDGRRMTLGTVKTEREAKRLAQRSAIAAEEGRLVTSKKRTLGEYLDWWLDQISPSLREKSSISYGVCIKRVKAHIGNVRLDRLKATDVQGCYTRLLQEGVTGSPLSARSVQQTHTVLHGALRRAVQLDLISRNPVDAATPPRPKRVEMQTLTSEQCSQLFQATREDSLGALWVLLITAGPRLGEALGLQWVDINFEEKRLEIRRALQRHRGQGLVFVEPKSSSSRRVIELSEFAATELREHRRRQLEHRLLVGPEWKDTGVVFTSDIGTPLDPRNVWRRFRQALQKADLPSLRIHDLRHTAATLHLQKGTHPRAVQAMLGHGSWALTMNTYSHVAPMMQRDAANRMDALFPTRLSDSA